jgi:hypothetical protein
MVCKVRSPARSRANAPELSVRSELVAARREGVIRRGQIDSDSRISVRMAIGPASSVIRRTLWRYALRDRARRRTNTAGRFTGLFTYQEQQATDKAGRHRLCR